MKCKLCKNKITGAVVEKLDPESHEPISVPFCMICYDEALKGERKIPNLRLIENQEGGS